MRTDPGERTTAMTTNLDDLLGGLTPRQQKLVRARLAQQAAAPAPADAFPLSPAQERLWLADRLSPGQSAPVTLAIRLTGPLDRDRLHTAIADVIARQSALRTVFRETPDGPRQVILDEFRPPMVTAAPSELAERIRPVFDLTAEPPVAVTLFETRPADHLLLICVHHIVIDGWSTQVFLDELIACYGGNAALPELRLRFADYAVAEREAVGRLAEQVAYWRERLAGAPALSTVPPDRPRPPVQRRRGAHADFTVGAEVADRLTALARRTGSTLNTVVTAAFAVLLRHATGQDDVLFGTPVARRRRTELEPLIGSIADTVVTRVDLTGDPSGEELLRRVQRSAAAAVAHQDVPFSELVRELAPARRLAYNPFFQIMLSVSEIAVGAKEAGGVTFTPERVETGTTEFDLFLTVRRGPAGLTGVLGYNTDLYLAETARYLTDGLVTVLTALAAAPDRPVAGLLPVRRRVEVAASFTAEPMGDAMRFWAGFRRVPADARFAPYGQVLQQLLAGDGGDAQVVLLRWSDWTRRKAASADFLDDVVDELLAGVRAFRARTAVPLLVLVCPSEPGTDFAAADERLARGLAAVRGVEVTWPEEYAAALGVTEIADPAADALGHVPYTEEFFAALGTLAVDRLHAGWGIPRPGPGRAAYAATHLATAARIAAAARPVAGPTPDEAEYVAPRTETEKRLAVLWADQLGTGEAGVRTSFFALGGHSLLVTRMLALVHREFGVSVPFHEFYADPVIAALATTIDLAGETAPEAAGIRPAPRDEPVEPAATQKRLWALAKLGVHSGAVTFAATLTGPLDEAALRGAVDDVVRRHESLRTTIGTERGRPVLIVHKGLDCWWPGGGTDVDAAVRELATHPYDLETGPLLRIRLLPDGPDRHHLLIGLHQVVCDNESWHVLLTDLAAAYRARLGLGEPLPPLPVQMADYAVWEREQLAGPAAAADAAYWAECLRGAPPRLELARARPRASGTAGVRHRRLGEGLGPRIGELARVAGVSTFVVLLTAYALTLGEEAGRGDVVLGVPSAGRDRPELQGVVGRFAHLMPIRLNLAGATTSRALLHRVHEAVLTAQRHRGVPFSRIVDVVRPPRERAHHPVFQHALNVVGERSAGLDLPEVSVRALDTPLAATQYELFLHLHWENGELGATAEYDRGRLGEDVVADLVTRFESVVRRLGEGPDDAVPGPALSEPVRTAAPGLTLATTGPAEPLRREAEQLLTRFAVPPGLTVTSRVFGTLLDPGGAGGLTAVVLRWADLIGAPIPTRPGTLVRRLDDAVTDVVAAARAHRSATSRPLVLLTQASDGLPPRLEARLDARLFVELAGLPATEVLTGPAPGAAEVAVGRLHQALHDAPLPAGQPAEGPRDDRERALARIWAGLLDLDPARIGVHSDFFALGGDSLLAIQAAHLAAEAGIAVTPRQFSACPTIAELVALPREKDVTRP